MRKALLYSFVVLISNGCQLLNKEEDIEEEEEEQRITHEYLQYRDVDNTRVRVWSGLEIARTYYIVRGYLFSNGQRPRYGLYPFENRSSIQIRYGFSLL